MCILAFLPHTEGASYSTTRVLSTHSRACVDEPLSCRTRHDGCLRADFVLRELCFKQQHRQHNNGVNNHARARADINDGDDDNNNTAR